MTYQLGEPFFEEKGKITNHQDIGDNRSKISFSGGGTMKGDIEVTNSGDFIETQKGNNVTQAQGQGVLSTKDGSERVSYTFHAVGNVTGEGKPILLGSAIYSTDSKGKLAFINNVISFFKVEVDTGGNFLSIERELNNNLEQISLAAWDNSNKGIKTGTMEYPRALSPVCSLETYDIHHPLLP